MTRPVNGDDVLTHERLQLQTLETDSAGSKILLVGSNSVGSLENAYLRALTSAGIRASIFNVSKHRHELPRRGAIARGINRIVLTPISTRAIQKELVRFFSSQGAGVDIIVVFKGTELPRAVLEQCRAMAPKGFWVNINPDDPLGFDSKGSTNKNIAESIGFYDLYCMWSDKLVQKVVSAGAKRAICLPFGYDAERHRPSSEIVKQRECFASFVGAWDRQREAIISSVADLGLRVYGEGWDRISRDSPLRGKVVARNVYGSELAAIYSNSTISLNVLRSQNAGSHNMRTFEIPAMGGLMLTTRSSGQQIYFPEGEACLMYEGPHELRQKAQFVASNPEIAQRIRRRGSELCSGHSYIDRARDLMRIIEIEKRKKSLID